jgi:cellulose synthase/poly-beta-1,6-N-acetylglucosamine synthase-like glycosyltransferase
MEGILEQTSHRPLRLGEALIARGLLRPEDLEWALEIQARTREPLGQILLSRGLVRRYDLYRTLAELWGIPFVDLLQEPPDTELLRRFPPEQMLARQLIPLRQLEEGLEIATARRPDSIVLEEAQRLFGQPIARIRATTEWDIRQILLRAFRTEILTTATYGLYYRRPEESAHTVFTPGQFLVMTLLLVGTLLALGITPRATLIAINAAINIFFLASILFKFAVSMVGARYEREVAIREEEIRALKDEELPRYTILVPVYREAEVIQTLLANLARLDYPREKLEILLLLEEDDQETLEAAKAARPPGNVYFIRIPNAMPRTKPKACNIGLFFATGDYLVIYDAEDQPEPDQLKKAVLAFRKGGERLACVQAALNYFNARENFLTRMFTLEYSYWFDYMLPGLHRLGLPIPLGGTSNHFPTERLRMLGGWDPFNVTEDADLGIRAAVEGWEVGVIHSTTYEEANTQVGNWIRQRSRWIKGYMQTTLVHTRNPWQLIRRVGLRKAAGFLLLVGGTPLTFLSAPWMWAMFLWWVITQTRALDPFFPPPVLYISLFNLLFGNAIAIYLNMLAGFKRGYYDLIPWALLTPVYWVLHSIAAYKALWQLFTRPFYWEKTPPWDQPLATAIEP